MLEVMFTDVMEMCSHSADLSAGGWEFEPVCFSQRHPLGHIFKLKIPCFEINYLT